MSVDPFVNFVRFGFAPRGSPSAGTGTDFPHEVHYLSGLPSHMVRFGHPPSGTSQGQTGTDFRHEVHFLSGLPNHMVRFGRQPVGTTGSGPVSTGLPHNRQFLADVGFLMGR